MRMKAPRRRAAAGEVFFGEVCKNKSISPSNAICPAYQKTGQPPWVVRFLMIYSYVTYQLLPLLLTVHSAHCSLQIAHCQLSIRYQKKFPGTGPRAYCIYNTVCKTGGLAPGKVSQGEAWRGVPLLKRPTPPRSSLKNFRTCRRCIWSGSGGRRCSPPQYRRRESRGR